MIVFVYAFGYVFLYVFVYVFVDGYVYVFVYVFEDVFLAVWEPLCNWRDRKPHRSLSGLHNPHIVTWKTREDEQYNYCDYHHILSILGKQGRSKKRYHYSDCNHFHCFCYISSNNHVT